MASPAEPKGTLLQVQTGLSSYQQLLRSTLLDKVRGMLSLSEADLEVFLDKGFEKVCRSLWDEGSLWAVRADWFVDEVHERVLTTARKFSFRPSIVSFH